MKTKICDEDRAAAELPPRVDDKSGIGVYYVDAYLKPLNTTLEDGRKVTGKRKGLKITLQIGDAAGEGLLRRIENGPDVRSMLRHALEEAARGAGARFFTEEGGVWLEVEE